MLQKAAEPKAKVGCPLYITSKLVGFVQSLISVYSLSVLAFFLNEVNVSYFVENYQRIQRT